jgi:hypothetical protein
MQKLKVSIWVNRNDSIRDNRTAYITIQNTSTEWEDIYEDIYSAIDKVYPELSVEHLADYVEGYGIVSIETEDGKFISNGGTTDVKRDN